MLSLSVLALHVTELGAEGRSSPIVAPVTEDRRYPSPEPPAYGDGWQGFPTAGSGYDHGGHSADEQPYDETGPGADPVGLTYDGFVRPRASAEDSYNGFATPIAGGDYAYDQQVHGYGPEVAGYGIAEQPGYQYPDDAGPYGPDDYDADPEATYANAPAPYAPDPYASDPYAPDQHLPDPYAADPDQGYPRTSFVAAAPTEHLPAVTDFSDVGNLIDLSKPRPLPVTHRGQRRRHVALLTTVAVGVMIAGGVGYAVFRPSGEQTTAGPAIITTDGPTAEPDATADLFGDPSGAPVQSASPSPTPSSASPSPSATSSPAAITAPALPARPTTPIAIPPEPTDNATRPGVSPTDLQPPPAAPPAPLTASLSQDEDDDELEGTVRVSNPAGSAANGFTVRLTVPGATGVSVTGGNVSASRNGDSITFRSGATIAAGSSVTFRFTVDGPLSGQAGGCTIDGNSCN